LAFDARIVHAVETGLVNGCVQHVRLNQQIQAATAALRNSKTARDSCMQTSSCKHMKQNPALTRNADADASRHASVMYSILLLSFIPSASTRIKSTPNRQMQQVTFFSSLKNIGAAAASLTMRRLKDVPEPLNNELGQSSSMEQAYNATAVVDENEEPPATYTNPGGVVLPDASSPGKQESLSQAAHESTCRILRTNTLKRAELTPLALLHCDVMQISKRTQQLQLVMQIQQCIQMALMLAVQSLCNLARLSMIMAPYQYHSLVTMRLNTGTLL
jgi:hypothetical protein